MLLRPPTTAEQREQFMSHRVEIEKKAGFALQWRMHANLSRLVVVVSNTDMPLNNRTGWAALQEWTADTFLELEKSAAPHLHTLFGAPYRRRSP
jgi:hypothetical protein